MIIRRSAMICFVLFAVTVIPVLARSAEPASYYSAKPAEVWPQWTIHATPYGWLPFLNGASTIRGRTTNIDLAPYQVLQDLDAAPWMSNVEFRKGALVLYNDIFYAKLGASGGGVRAADFGPILTGSFGASAALQFEQLVVELGGAYEVARWYGSSATGATFTAIEVLAGARYWRQQIEVSIGITGSVNIGGFEFSGGRAINRGGSVEWIDPLIGVRLRHGLSPGQEVVVRADIGGFDIGSNFSWNLMGAFSFDLGARDGVKYSGMLGYRALDVDYSEGSGLSLYRYNVLQHGPIIGVTVTF